MPKEHAPGPTPAPTRVVPVRVPVPTRFVPALAPAPTAGAVAACKRQCTDRFFNVTQQ